MFCFILQHLVSFVRAEFQPRTYNKGVEDFKYIYGKKPLHAKCNRNIMYLGPQDPPHPVRKEGDLTDRDVGIDETQYVIVLLFINLYELRPHRSKKAPPHSFVRAEIHQPRAIKESRILNIYTAKNPC